LWADTAANSPIVVNAERYGTYLIKLHILKNFFMTSKNYFKALSILNLAMILGIVLFGLIVGLLSIAKSNSVDDSDLTKIFNFLLPALPVLCIFISNYLFKRRLNQIADIYDLPAKMENYRNALILRYAVLEAPAIFAIIATLLTGNLYFLFNSAMMVFLMFYFRPRPQNAILNMQLDQQDSLIIQDPDGII
jgi:purine-cytosine permease-like protein